MSIVELCVVCADPLRVGRRCHTRYCRSTCRVRALRARRKGTQVSALRTRYTALRIEAALRSRSDPEPGAAASLCALAEQERRAESLARQLVHEQQQAAASSAQLVTAEKAAQAERAQQERAVQDLQARLREALKKDSDQEADLSRVGAKLVQARQQLTQVTVERDQARKSAAGLAAELQGQGQRLVEAEQQRDSAKRALTAPRPVPPAQPSAELTQAQRAVQTWQGYAWRLEHEREQRDTQWKQHLTQLDQEHHAKLATLTQDLKKAYERDREGQKERDTLEAERKRLAQLRQNALASPAPALGGPADRQDGRYDPTQDRLLVCKRDEIEASDELESWQNGTGRRRAQTKDLDQRAFEAAHAARCSFLAHPPTGYRKRILWSIPDRVLDADSEKCLCKQSVQRSAELFLKLPFAARLKGR